MDWLTKGRRLRVGMMQLTSGADSDSDWPLLIANNLPYLPSEIRRDQQRGKISARGILSGR